MAFLLKIGIFNDTIITEIRMCHILSFYIFGKSICKGTTHQMKQPHGRMSTKWAPHHGGIRHDRGITRGVPIT